MPEELKQAPATGGVAPATTAQGVAPATTQTATEGAQMVPVSELEKLRQQRERDVAAVKAAEQKRAAQLERQLYEARQVAAQAQAEKDRQEQAIYQQQLQSATPEQRAQYEVAWQKYQLDRQAQDIEQRAQQIKRQELIAAAQKYRDEQAQYWHKQTGIPVEQLDMTSPDAMRDSAMMYLQVQQLRASNPAAQANRVTGSVANVPPTSQLRAIQELPYAERVKAHAKLLKQVRANKGG